MINFLIVFGGTLILSGWIFAWNRLFDKFNNIEPYSPPWFGGMGFTIFMAILPCVAIFSYMISTVIFR